MKALQVKIDRENLARLIKGETITVNLPAGVSGELLIRLDMEEAQAKKTPRQDLFDYIEDLVGDIFQRRSKR